MEGHRQVFLLLFRLPGWADRFVVIEPSERWEDWTTGGLGATDIGNKQAIGGISREFYQNVKNTMKILLSGNGRA